MKKSAFFWLITIMLLMVFCVQGAYAAPDDQLRQKVIDKFFSLLDDDTIKWNCRFYSYNPYYNRMILETKYKGMDIVLDFDPSISYSSIGINQSRKDYNRPGEIWLDNQHYGGLKEKIINRFGNQTIKDVERKWAKNFVAEGSVVLGRQITLDNYYKKQIEQLLVELTREHKITWQFHDSYTLFPYARLGDMYLEFDSFDKMAQKDDIILEAHIEDYAIGISLSRHILNDLGFLNRLKDAQKNIEQKKLESKYNFIRATIKQPIITDVNERDLNQQIGEVLQHALKHQEQWQEAEFDEGGDLSFIFQGFKISVYGWEGCRQIFPFFKDPLFYYADDYEIRWVTIIPAHKENNKYNFDWEKYFLIEVKDFDQTTQGMIVKIWSDFYHKSPLPLQNSIKDQEDEAVFKIFMNL